MASFAQGIDQKVKDELKDVDAQVKANSDKISFSHGTCPEHLEMTLRTIPGMTPERIKSMVDKSKSGNPIPCLITNTELRHAYMRGLFTQEQMKKAVQGQQQAQQSLKEHFQKLAGIIKS
jgi:hypothetical protein